MPLSSKITLKNLILWHTVLCSTMRKIISCHHIIIDLCIYCMLVISLVDLPRILLHKIFQIYLKVERIQNSLGLTIIKIWAYLFHLFRLLFLNYIKANLRFSTILSNSLSNSRDILKSSCLEELIRIDLRTDHVSCLELF